ncbi:MAG: helix-turn-helix transcriptional regulator [Planctomycetes bacterium]|nr:helix-turn-helix transcriptional regulator [Planctomycetota bacterium]
MLQAAPLDERLRPLLDFDVAFALFRRCGSLEYASPAARRVCGEPDAGPVEHDHGVAWRFLSALAVGTGAGESLAHDAGVVSGPFGRCRATVHRPVPQATSSSVVIVLQPHPVDVPDDLGRFDLTPRECEVVRLLALGLAIKQVAGRLGVSYHTARHHTERIYAKLGVHGRVEVARAIMRPAPASRPRARGVDAPDPGPR